MNKDIKQINSEDINDTVSRSTSNGMDEIKDEKINTGIDEIKNIKMMDHEKSHILQSILGENAVKALPVRSPWSIFSFKSTYSPYLRLAVYLILILTGGGIIVTTTSNKTGRESTPSVDLYKSLNTYNSQQPVETGGSVTKENPPEKITGNIGGSTTSGGSYNPSEIPATSSSSSSLSFSMSPTSGTSESNSINYTEIASPAFTKYLEQEKNEGHLLDYKIERSVYFAAKKTANDVESEWFNTGNSNEAFIVRIYYSTKTTDEGADGWTLDKSSYVTIDKINSVYTVVSVKDNI